MAIKPSCRILYNLSSKLYVEFSRVDKLEILLNAKIPGKNTVTPDWVYWTKRLGRDPTIPQRVARLIRKQCGRCGQCNLSFTSQEVLEVHHIDGNHANNKWENLQLLHGHCHNRIHATVKMVLATTAP